jgi:hypothetical protein
LQEKEPQIVYCPRSSIENRTDEITLPGSLEAGDEQSVSVFTLVDCGAERNFADFYFCKQNGIEMIRLPSRLVLRLLDGSRPETGVIDYYVILPIRIHDTFYKVPCLVTRLDPKHPVVLGMTFLNDEFPQYVELLRNIGKRESLGGSTDETPRTLSVPAIPDITDPATSVKENPIALQPSRDPKAAFSAGGLLSAIEAEENRRKASLEEANTLLRLRAATVHRLEEFEETLAMRAASINGLTRNAEDWLDSIPDYAKRFAASVFSDGSARDLPPSRPGLDCTITVRDGEKLSACKLYDMSKEQLTTLRQILDEQLEKGFIQPSCAGNASPVFFVNDKASSSRGVDQLGLVVDYRDLNSKILLDEEYVYSNNTTGMVYATKENSEMIDRVASLTSLSRKQVLQAMSNERKRLKSQGYKDCDLKLIATTGGLSKQIEEVRQSLQVSVEQEQCPSHVVDQLQELESVVVCNPRTLDNQTLTPFTI